MGRNEKDQKISAMIMTNNKTPKMLFYITKEGIRFNGPLINLLKIHIYVCVCVHRHTHTHIHTHAFYLKRKVGDSEIRRHPIDIIMHQIHLEPEKWQQKMQR